MQATPLEVVNASANDFLDQFWPATIDGLPLGSIYALIALGYTMVYGVLRLINFAHSEVFMIGTFDVRSRSCSGISSPLTGLRASSWR